MRTFKVGIDSYCLKPLGLSPFEVLDWAIINGAEGVQFSEGAPGQEGAPDKSFLTELRSYADENRFFLEWGGGEHIPLDMASGRRKDIEAVNRRAAEQAEALGVATIRSCSGGLMRWAKNGPSTDELLRLTASSLRAQAPMLRDHGVALAIETHFEFTSFELLRLLEMSGAVPDETLGICLDTMNLLTMLEDPVSATERLLPWVVTTHVKDGGLLLTPDGLTSFPAQAGTGVVDLAGIMERLSTTEPRVNLCLEDHGGDFQIPIFDDAFLGGFPDLTASELTKLVKLAVRTGELHAAKKLRPLDRSRWPEACERRTKSGLKALRRIVDGRTG